MGQVYRARDTKLNRDVALKILPASFAADGERVTRFRREAQVLAALNHPHIAQIYGLDEVGGTRFLVLELVDGETLDRRIAREPIPVDESLAIAKQIAEALEAAHEKGIIHRDLKPANIALTSNATVKVLDFGLAKATDAPSITSLDLANSPTLTSPAMMTGVGVILGTAAYMSPEQAKGRTADRRSDIWAFGCVLFETLSGSVTFGGETLTDVVAAVMKNEPDWRALPADTPLGIRSLLGRCLRKDPALRLHDIADVRIEIQDAIAQASLSPETVHRRSVTLPAVRALPWVVAGLLAVTLLVTLLGLRHTVLPGGAVTHLDLIFPAGVEPPPVYAPSVAVSPDGTRFAFIGQIGAVRQLYVRRLDQSEWVPLRGTGNAQSIFFSPDGRTLGFISPDRSLKKVSLADGLVTPLARDADISTGAAWGADERITFGRAGTLWQILASGGSAKQITTLDSGKHEIFHAWPTVVAAGKILLFTSITSGDSDASHIEAVSLASGERRTVQSGTFPLYAPSGHLIFFRDGALLAVPFDIDRLESTAPVARVVENVAVDVNTGAPFAALSSSGVLVYAPGDAGTSRLVWVSREGTEQPATDTVRRYQYPRLSPDGRRIVVTAAGDLWIQEIARPTFTRLTSERTVGNSYPVWTPDGKYVVFKTARGMQWVSADGTGGPQAIPGSSSVVDTPSSVSTDGDTLAFLRPAAETSSDVYVVSLRGRSSPRPVVSTRAYEGAPQFSPDGRWLAYTSDESGQMQVYVRPFPAPDRRWEVSTEGGTQPMWNRNGKEIFYRTGNKMMAVGVSTTGDFTLSQPRQLFDQPYVFQNTSIADYDVSSDGQRFIMVKNEGESSRLSVVLNWFEELKARMPAK
jgi:Tol biopolymer transport system component